MCDTNINLRALLGRVLFLLTSLYLCACVGSAIPVVDRTGGSSSTSFTGYSNGHSKANSNRVRLGFPASGKHTVGKGDTLYSIAFAYGLNVKQLAAGNGIKSPYTIQPGQRINLRSSAVPAWQPKTRVAEAPRDRNKQSKNQSAAKVANNKKTAGKSKPVSTVSSKTAKIPASANSWQWPAGGKLLARYGDSRGKDSVNKGIDIAGKKGQAVRAARAGTVVYSGNGVQGYGNLVIVRHSSEFLSAYAYNRVLVVKEGQAVKEGQKIAEIGSSGSAQENKLHFEIRKSGQPVNPLKLLPSRG